MKVAYVVNQHPKVSHSFIRREIAALGRSGIEVARIAMRGWDAPTPDPHDADEKRATFYVLQRSVPGLLAGVCGAFLAAPGRFLRTLALTFKLAVRSDRPSLLHLVYFVEACVTARWVARERVQHIHAHFGTNSTDVALLTAELANVPFSFTAHGPEEFDRPLGLNLGEKIRRAAFVVAISSFGRSQLFRWVEHAHWHKIKIVRCGVDEAYLAHHEPSRPSADFVCIGRLCEQKGQLLLVSAFQKVVQSGTDCRLVLGGDGEFRDEIERLVRRFGLERHVRITGWISGPQVRAEILNARALVLASFAEGLPVVIMEAMAMGKPVVSTYVAGIPELVVPGETGWLVPAGDESKLVAAIKDCADTPLPTLVAMGQRARLLVEANHDVNKEAAKLAELFKRGVSQATADPVQRPEAALPSHVPND